MKLCPKCELEFAEWRTLCTRCLGPLIMKVERVSRTDERVKNRGTGIKPGTVRYERDEQ